MNYKQVGENKWHDNPIIGKISTTQKEYTGEFRNIIFYFILPKDFSIHELKNYFHKKVYNSVSDIMLHEVSDYTVLQVPLFRIKEIIFNI